MRGSLRLVRLLVPFLAVVVWAWFIFWMSTRETPLSVESGGGGNLLNLIPRADLFAHGLAYAILSWLIMLAVLPVKLCKPIRISLHYIMPVVVVGVYGIAMELVQEGIAERSAEVIDVIADVAGALCSMAFMLYLWPEIKRLRFFRVSQP